MLTLVNPEKRVPSNHPIRRIKPLAEAALKELSPLFEQMYSEVGRPSIPPERLLKASLLMALYTVRSERMFCEQLDYNLLFRWFLDLNWDEPGFDHSSFSRNRARLLEHDVAGEFFRTVVAEARELRLTSDQHSRVAQPLGFCPHRSERTDFPYSALLEVYPDFSRRPPRERQPDGVEGARSARAAGRTGPSSNAAGCGAPAHGTRCAPPGSESLPACASFLAGHSRRSARPRPCKASDAVPPPGRASPAAP